MTEGEPKWFLKKTNSAIFDHCDSYETDHCKKTCVKKSILVAARTPKRELQKGP